MDISEIRADLAEGKIRGGYIPVVSCLLELVDKQQRHLNFKDLLIEAHKNQEARYYERVRELEEQVLQKQAESDSAWRRYTQR